MRFWDSSAIVPLLVNQASSVAVSDEAERDPEFVVWWGTGVECVSACTRLEREGRITPAELGAAIDNLPALAASWQEVQPAARLRQAAERLLRTHPLRAADALQLAAAIAAADGDPRSLPFVTLDDRLARAAQREGFPVVEPA
ncbi:MAG: type II toxin-antitoxin system VapC family toxin [Acidimicrobiales bacterium]|nr:type II toxin-antitoxin system VapC family toxin [Acidimicrobiales bacterium]